MAPVNSNMITTCRFGSSISRADPSLRRELTKLTVILVTPAKALAAPMTAYTGGEIHLPSAGQLTNSHAVGLAFCSVSMTMPRARPTHAPTVREGKKIPAGIEAPNVIAVSNVLANAVTSKRTKFV